MEGHHFFGHGHHGPSHQPLPPSSGQDPPTVKIFCRSSEIYCLVARDGQVVLAPANPRDPLQHWFKDMKHSTNIKDEEGLPAFALVNKATGEAIKHSLGQLCKVRLVPYNREYLDESVLWSESHDVGNGFRCIRMVNNICLNFDALYGDEDHGGVHDGTPVVLWNWCQGDNQSWKIVPYGDEADLMNPVHASLVSHEAHGELPQPTVKIHCRADKNYNLTVRSNTVVLTLSNRQDPYQHWIKDMRYNSKIKDEEGRPAFALVNQATGQAIKQFLGESPQVKLVEYNPEYLDESVLWTESKDLRGGFRCIRMVNNIYLKFDALDGDKVHGGVHDGTVLVLRKSLKRFSIITKEVLWKGTVPNNQLWEIIPW